jgi:hypothetical protein
MHTETGEIVSDGLHKRTTKTQSPDLDFECSPDIAELSTALCKAQGAMTGAVKDSANPFFKSKYADLSAVWDDIRKPFAENGISVIQMPVEGVNGVGVITQFSHSSGQWMRSKLVLIPTKKVKDQSGQAIEVATNDPQVVGSCITYARRYALAAMGGVYQIDDDGNAASQPDNKRQLMDDSTPVDEKKIQELSRDAKDIVDLDDEENGPSHARELYEPLSSDERMRLQAVMKASKPEGCKQTYWAIFHKHLQKAA